ncbi:serine/threonine protein kinase-like protein [Plenodomus tracheiphilus IPT5]|uniref:non-specific serine/threonine protein kinase n=1 Tax=Plenodomus tracheiphilus IPT5 TaxID=1408161 RepID=A0A6A7B736_9PLEO|nr:serine/threonine protein kinase-like protein [Plenodomus tracheiphilus IPT5]
MKHLKPPLATTQPFKWKAQQWAKQKDIAFGVSIMYNKLNHKLLVVKKVVRIPDHSEKLRALEARALSLLPDCNRITKPLLDLIMEPDMDHATIFFEHFPLGDLKQWKTRKFDERNNKPVPESFIWRCFIQMSQAVAFIHNSVGSEPDANRHCLLHRDIKPNNILVVDNGTTYPSFQLHDFGCARLYQETLAGEPMYCGTYKWQPPENPFINTTEADIWALGACVHFLAVGRPPVQDLAGFTAQFKDNLHVEDFVRPGSLTEYASVGRYCGAHVPRKVTPINLSPEEQQERGIDPEIHQYSDNLADWMSLCLRFTPSERPSARRLLEEMVDDGKEILRSMGGQAALAHLELIVDDKAWG